MVVEKVKANQPQKLMHREIHAVYSTATTPASAPRAAPAPIMPLLTPVGAAAPLESEEEEEEEEDPVLALVTAARTPSVAVEVTA